MSDYTIELAGKIADRLVAWQMASGKFITSESGECVPIITAESIEACVLSEIRQKRIVTEEILREILSYFPNRYIVEALKADKGYGYRPMPLIKTPKDNALDRWLKAIGL